MEGIQRFPSLFGFSALAAASEEKRARRTKPQDDPSKKADDRSNLDAPKGNSLALWAGGLFTAIALFLAFPPAGWNWLVWFALVGWISLVRLDRLPGKRPYLAIYVCGALYWAMTLHFVTLPHWAGAFGLIALALYLGVYPVAFVWISRFLVYRRNWSYAIACPVVWIGLEWIRAWMFTGMPLATLGHALAPFPLLIQTADLFGAYAVSLLIVAANCAVAGLIPIGAPRRRTYWPVGFAAALLIAALCYGGWKLNETPPRASDEGLKVVLLQGSIDTHFGEDRATPEEIFEHYRRLAVEARATDPDADVILYPESAFPIPEFLFDEGELDENIRRGRRYRDFHLMLARGFDPNADGPPPLPWPDLLLGTHTVVYPSTDDPYAEIPSFRSYNSAAWVGDDNQTLGRYSKRHLVMFGEYIPGGTIVPSVYALSPNGRGLDVGDRAEVFAIDGKRLMPLICFESIVPQYVLVSRQEAESRGEGPDYLVNLTNDGWFFGSSLLDLHFYSNVFRAVEHRRPMLVAANTGFSGTIDGNGVVRTKGPRRAPKAIVDVVPLDGRESFYAATGDWFAMFCVGIVVIAIPAAWLPRFRDPRTGAPPSTPPPTDRA